MNQFNNEMKTLSRKLVNNQLTKEDVDLAVKLCGDKIGDFQLYSLALKYYSYMERYHGSEDQDFDIEDHIDYDHEHSHNHDHDHDHNHDHDHDHDQDQDHEHNHDHDHDHSHDHHHHDHDCGHEALTCESLDELIGIFENYMEGMSRGDLLPELNLLLELREGLKDHVQVLTAYGDEITLLENVYYKSRYNDENMMVMDSDESFAKRVTEILMATENSTEIREHLKIIYPELPMRMTKNKFFGFIDEYFVKLQGIPSVDVKNHIQMIKESFDPKCVEGYGQIAGEIAAELEDVKTILLDKDKSKADKDSAYHHMYHLTEDKNALLEKALDVQELLNHLVGLCLVKFDGETSEVYGSIKPLFQNEKDELVLGGVFEDVEANYEPLGEALTKVSAMIDGMFEYKHIFEGLECLFEIEELRYAFELTKEGYFIERPHDKDESVPGFNELALIKNELVGYMDEVLSLEGRTMRRGRMSLMMSIFQIVHTTGQEIYDHIYSSMTSCNVKGEKVMSMQNIYSYLNQFMD